MPAQSGESVEDPLRYTRIFSSGLRAGIPWDRLMTMRLPELLMFLQSTVPQRNSSDGTRDATLEDIDRLLG